MAQKEVFLKHVCKVVDHLSQSELSTQILGPHTPDLIKIFVDILSDPSKNILIVSSCFSTAINLIRCSESVSLSNTYLDFVLTSFPDIQRLEKERRDLFSAGLLTIGQVCLMTIRKNKGSITMDQLSTLYNLVVEHYKKLNDVDGDGYYLISALAFFIPNDRRLIDDFWKYIEFGLKKTTQEDIFKATVSCICDFTATYREQISDKIDPIIEQIIQLYEVLVFLFRKVISLDR